ncbi:MAG TPA: hypothetical protein VK970_10275, partial [Candidatus Methylacidiphilales bacterium]|nr:hypothetical protein [Candidatus Methylacidiphilales bacterium]
MKLCIATTLGRKARGCLAAACAMAALTLILCGATLNAVAQSEDAASPSIDPGSPNAGKSAATTPATPKAATEKTKEKAKPKAKTSETKPESTSVTSTNAAPKKPAKSTASGTATTTRKTGTGGSGDGPSKTASTNGPPAIILRG